jgi:hypothetical protein
VGRICRGCIRFARRYFGGEDLTYSSTLLPQTNEPAEIQKAILDLLKKINEIGSEIIVNGIEPGETIYSNPLSGVVYTPIQNIWYNAGGESITLDPGVWDISCMKICSANTVTAGGLSIFLTLALTPTSETYLDETAQLNINTAGVLLAPLTATLTVKMRVSLQNRTTFYANIKTSYPNATAISISGLRPVMAVRIT